jgi:integrase
MPEDWHDHDLVFCQAGGKPIDPGADYNAWRRLLKRGEVRDARLHDARHTAATFFSRRGCGRGSRSRCSATRRSP